MEQRRIDFLFKGDREYVHGTDMFNAIVGSHAPAVLRDVHFMIHRMVRMTSCEIYESDRPGELVDLQAVKVRATFKLAGAGRWVFLKECVGAPNNRRYEYF